MSFLRALYILAERFRNDEGHVSMEDHLVKFFKTFVDDHVEKIFYTSKSKTGGSADETESDDEVTSDGFEAVRYELIPEVIENENGVFERFYKVREIIA